MPTKILFLVSQTADHPDVEAQVEHREVTDAIEDAVYGDGLFVVWASAVRVDDLLRLLNKHEPAIVHFSGHGDGQGGIVLRDHHDASVSVDAQQLQRLFSNFRTVVRMVVLNACYTDSQASAIAQEVECAIGTTSSIGALAARTFSRALYGAIASGRHVVDAYQQAVTALHLNESGDKHVTRIVLRTGADANTITFVPRSSPKPGPSERVPVSETLEHFLRARFTDSEFGEFAQRVGGEDIDWGLYPSSVERVLEVMVEHDRIGPAFFVALQKELPKYRARIERLRDLRKGGGTA